MSGIRSDDPLSRRRLLTSAGTLGLVASAGCLDGLVGGNDGGRTVEPEEPGDDPEGTPEEFYYYLANLEEAIDDDELVDRLDFTVDSMTHVDTEEQEEIHLFYASGAENYEESDEELLVIAWVYREMIAEFDLDASVLFAEIVDGFENQIEQWRVEREWARQNHRGELSDVELLNLILNTGYWGGIGPEEARG